MMIMSLDIVINQTLKTELIKAPKKTKDCK